MPRTFAIGDIHGCHSALLALVKTVPLRDDDLLITLGDYVDRGPASRQVINWLIDRYKSGTLIPIRGNHDQLFQEARYETSIRNMWISVGGVQTLMSYGSDGIIATLDDVPDSHFDFLEVACRRYYETETHIFVHAMIEAEIPLTEQTDDTIYWTKFRNPSPHCSGKIMVCGHTAQKNGQPLSLGHAICIDTWVYGGGWLTCLNVETGDYWQSRESGEIRQLRL